MGQFNRNKSYNHKVRKIFVDCYRVEWVVDRYYPGSRLRHPTSFSRDTDRAGAERFCKKWGIALSESAQ